MHLVVPKGFDPANAVIFFFVKGLGNFIESGIVRVLISKSQQYACKTREEKYVLTQKVAWSAEGNIPYFPSWNFEWDFQERKLIHLFTFCPEGYVKLNGCEGLVDVGKYKAFFVNENSPLPRFWAAIEPTFITLLNRVYEDYRPLHGGRLTDPLYSDWLITHIQFTTRIKITRHDR